MTHFTSITYQMKREILSFSNKISRHLSRHLDKGVPPAALQSYLSMIRSMDTRHGTQKPMQRKEQNFFFLQRERAYLSHAKVHITAARKDIYLTLVYGLSEHPMMLATNKDIRSKEDVVEAARLYFYITVCMAFLAHISMKP